jgi:L-cysteine:1D-myo-inositol 2-amino-2-deoxy-alpha-D-glucopyranoside ligase
VRLAISAQHYRSSWDWTNELIEGAIDRLARWRAAGEGKGALDEVRDRLDDDLDTPGAIEAIDAAAAEGDGVSSAALLLGVSTV